MIRARVVLETVNDQGIVEREDSFVIPDATVKWHRAGCHVLDSNGTPVDYIPDPAPHCTIAGLLHVTLEQASEHQEALEAARAKGLTPSRTVTTSG